MSSIDRFIGAFWERVASNVVPGAGGLGVLRVIASLYVLLLVAPDGRWVNDAPSSFFNPPRVSVMGWFSGFPPPLVVSALDGLTIVLACLVLAGVRARASCLALVLVGAFLSNITYCFGKIDHDGLIWAFFGCMAFSGWGRTLALVPDQPNRFDGAARSLALLGVCIGFAMSVVGIKKALSWLDFDLSTGGFLGWFAYGYFEDGRRYLLAPYVLRIPPLGLELIDYAGVIFETSSFVALLWGPIAWRVWLTCAFVFHLINTLTLNIPFLLHVPVYLAFVDFTSAEAAAEKYWKRRAVRLSVALVTAGIGLGHLCVRWAGKGHSMLFVVDEIRSYHLGLLISALVFAGGTLVLLAETARRWRRTLQPSQPG